MSSPSSSNEKVWADGVPIHHEHDTKLDAGSKAGGDAAVEAAEQNAIRTAYEDRSQVEACMADMYRAVDQQSNHSVLRGKLSSFFQLSFANPKHFTIVMAAFASMGGCLFGLDQSLISGAVLFFPKELGFDQHQVSMISSAMPLGAVGGAILLSPANQYLGRRWAIIAATLLYTLGAGLQAGARNYGFMIAGRVILGLGVGIETGTVPVYVAETVERRLRGNLVSAYQLNIALGEVFGYVVAAIFLNVKGNWRYILGSSVIFSTIMGVGMLFLPESPRFLMYQGKPVDAFRVWCRIRDMSSYEAKAEFFIMKETVEGEVREIQNHGSRSRFIWMDFFTVPRARRAIVYATIMILLGQFVGINGIMYYMGTLFKQVGYSDAEAIYLSMVGGGALLLGTIPAIFNMERCGRRFWALTMLPGFFIGLILAGLSFQYSATTDPSKVEGLYLAGLVIYLGFYGPYACLTWVIPSEVYPTYLRSYGMTTSDAMVFLGSFIITYNFADLQSAFTSTGLFIGFFGGIAIVGWVYQLLFMPETKDMTLEQIDQLFSIPTGQLVRENLASSVRTFSHLVKGRWGEAFSGFHRERRRGSVTDGGFKSVDFGVGGRQDDKGQA